MKTQIRYNQTKHFLKRIDDFKAKGEEFLRTISTSLDQSFPDRFKESNSTDTCLHLKFFGLTLLVRVEIEIEQDEPGRIRTYICDEATPPRLRLLEFEYAFDELGNVNRVMTVQEAAARFGLDLIEHLRSKNITLLL